MTPSPYRPMQASSRGSACRRRTAWRRASGRRSRSGPHRQDRGSRRRPVELGEVRLTPAPGIAERAVLPSGGTEIRVIDAYHRSLGIDLREGLLGRARAGEDRTGGESRKECRCDPAGRKTPVGSHCALRLFDQSALQNASPQERRFAIAAIKGAGGDGQGRPGEARPDGDASRSAGKAASTSYRARAALPRSSCRGARAGPRRPRRRRP